MPEYPPRLPPFGFAPCGPPWWRRPRSIIITTLATHSYERAVARNTYQLVYDLMLDVVIGMPDFIKVSQQTAGYWIANPSHPDKNVAERWDSDPSLAE